LTTVLTVPASTRAPMRTIRNGMVGTNEERRFQRTRIELPVQFAVKGSAEKHVGVARDVSIGGMSVETAVPLALGVRLFLSFAVPGQRNPALLSATVRWRDGRSMGIQFGLLGPRETHAITEVARASASGKG
jgi:type IV pilus assembly protein PilZ